MSLLVLHALDFGWGLAQSVSGVSRLQECNVMEKQVSFTSYVRDSILSDWPILLADQFPAVTRKDPPRVAGVCFVET